MPDNELNFTISPSPWSHLDAMSNSRLMRLKFTNSRCKTNPFDLLFNYYSREIYFINHGNDDKRSVLNNF